jgi:ribosomal protein L7/L12
MSVEYITFDKLQLRVLALEEKMDAVIQHLGMIVPDDRGSEISPEILDLVYQGDQAGAVKLYREETGVGLKAAKEVIESLSETI